MPKYLLQGSYTQPGAVGLMKDGGSKRLAVVTALVTQGGGTLEPFYFAFDAAATSASRSCWCHRTSTR